jgi:hypothetical protein
MSFGASDVKIKAEIIQNWNHPASGVHRGKQIEVGVNLGSKKQ